MKDYYSLLGIGRKATKAEIKKNYRILATKYHPDKNSDPNAAEKFIAITEAYEILSNPKTRTQYDLLIWEKLKRKIESKDNYNIVVPPRESTRTRRNKAQRKRSLNYHQADNESKKPLQLVTESFHIVSRYVSHILGITISLVILFSVITHLYDGSERNIIRGIVISAFIVGIVYCIFWLVKNAIQNFKKDIEAFSVFYKISQNKAAIFSFSIFAFVLLLYITLLKVYF